jgi:hypothetical protein
MSRIIIPARGRRIWRAAQKVDIKVDEKGKLIIGDQQAFDY